MSELRTVGTLRQAIAGFMRRSETSFVTTGPGVTPPFDALNKAINNARLYAERQIDFELSRVSVDVPNVSLTNGGSLNNAVIHGGVEKVSVKKIIRPFLAFIDGSGTFPIGFMTRDKWLARVQRRYENAVPTNKARESRIQSTPLVLIQQGTIIYVTPQDSSVIGSDNFTVFLDVFRWLDDYEGDQLSHTDYLIQYCFDWLMYRSIWELNFYLKDDERVILSETLIKSAWDAIIKWNANLIELAVDDGDLD